MRSRRVSVREAGILFVAVLMTAVYVYAILLASSPERDPVPALPSPWRLVDTIGRVIAPANPPAPVEAAPEAAGGAPVVASSDGVGGPTSAAFEPAGEVAAGRVAEVRRDLRSRDGVAPRRPADPAEPTAPGRGRGSGKGHAKKESGPRPAPAREKQGAKNVAAKADRGNAAGRPAHARASKPAQKAKPPAQKGKPRHSGKPAHAAAKQRAGGAHAKTPPGRARGQANKSHRQRK